MLIEHILAYIISQFYFVVHSDDPDDYQLSYLYAGILVFIGTGIFHSTISLSVLLLQMVAFIFGMFLLDIYVKKRFEKVLSYLFHDNPLLLSISNEETKTTIIYFGYLGLQLLVLFFINYSVLLFPEDMIEWIVALTAAKLIAILFFSFRQNKKLFLTLSLQSLLFSTAVIGIIAMILTYVNDGVSIWSMLLTREESITHYFTIRNGLFITLLLCKPVNTIIRSATKRFDPKESPDEDGYTGAGAMIGMLERILILISFMSGEILTVVATLSIKAFARYQKIMEDATFAEYFVIGTMLSVLLTLAAYFILEFGLMG